MTSPIIEEIMVEFVARFQPFGMRDLDEQTSFLRNALTTSYTEGFTAGVEKGFDEAEGVLHKLHKGKYWHATRDIRPTDEFYTDAFRALRAQEAALTQLTSTNEVK